MERTLQFPIKGTFYYSADMALDLSLIAPDSPLCFQLEPDNQYDKNAIQIWLPKSIQACFENRTDDVISHGLLLGYVPRSLAAKLVPYIQNKAVTALTARHYAKIGKQIEIDCQVTINQAWLAYLQLLIHTKIIISLHRFKRLKDRLLNKHF